MPIKRSHPTQSKKTEPARKTRRATEEQRERRDSEPFEVDGRTYRIDAQTGVKYEVLPKSEFIDGKPVLQVSDIGGFDSEEMDESASRFLGHLRVAPDKEEQKRLRAERERKELERKKAYYEANKKFIERDKQNSFTTDDDM